MEHLKFSESVNFETKNLSKVNLFFTNGRDFSDYDASTKDMVSKILDANALVLGRPVFCDSI